MCDNSIMTENINILSSLAREVFPDAEGTEREMKMGKRDRNLG